MENTETFSFRMISLKMVQTRTVLSGEKKRLYMLKGTGTMFISAEALPKMALKAVAKMLKMLGNDSCS